MILRKQLACMVLTTVTLFSLSVSASALDYSFKDEELPEYYASTSYEDIYGSQYNYSGPNVVDYQIPELEYGSFSATQTGIMEKAHLPGLQEYRYTASAGGYGVTTEGGIYLAAPEVQQTTPAVSYQQPAYTSAENMERRDGSIGTLQIPSLNISMKVWEGETNTSMSKGLGHYSSTSAWDGNVCLCGHNRGAKYTIGSIKNLEIGDVIKYTTVYGERVYQVSFVGTISSDDWSYLQATTDNRITLTTCLANQPEKRICVQAVQINN